MNDNQDPAAAPPNDVIEHLRESEGSTCGEALEYSSLLNVNGGDFQLIDIRAIIVLGVRDCGLQNLLDDDSPFFRAKLQDVQRLINFFATDQVGYKAAFLGRQAHAAEDSFSFHIGPIS